MANFADLSYNDIASRFPVFATDSLTEQGVIGEIIIASRYEIDPKVWGKLATEGLYYLVASKLANSKIAAIALQASQLGLEKMSDTNILSRAQSIDVDGEYAVTMSSSSTSSNITGGLATQAALKGYQLEYERLLSMLDTSPLYTNP